MSCCDEEKWLWMMGKELVVVIWSGWVGLAATAQGGRSCGTCWLGWKVAVGLGQEKVEDKDNLNNKGVLRMY